MTKVSPLKARPANATLAPVLSWRGAVLSTDVTSNARLVALVLSTHMSERGDSCFPSLDTLHRETRLARSTVCKALAELETAGLLDRQPGGPGKGSTRYRAVIPAALLDPAPSPPHGLGSPPHGLGSPPHGLPLVRHTDPRLSLEVDPIPCESLTLLGESEFKPEREQRAREPRRDELWDALTEAFGETTTRAEASRRGKVVKELRAIDATADDVALRVEEHRARRYSWTLTEQALMGWWTRLGESAGVSRMVDGIPLTWDA